MNPVTTSVTSLSKLQTAISPQLFAITAVFLLMTLACARTVPTPVSSGLATGETTHTLTHDGRNRSYLLYVPNSINWEEAVPLVLVFHGGAGNADTAVFMSGFNQVADQNGFIVAYPNGSGPLRDDKLLTWNAGACCAYAQENNIDDVGFARAVVADVQSVANIDSQRIYAAGMSNGGMMAQRLGCEAADLFAAIAPVAGTLNASPCNPSESISVIEFHGTVDQNVPYEGGYGLKSLVDVDFASVPDSIAFWTTFNACDTQPQTNTVKDAQHDTYAGCTDGAGVELYTVFDGGHAWPGGKEGRAGADQPVATILASQLIWEFFVAHPQP